MEVGQMLFSINYAAWHAFKMLKILRCLDSCYNYLWNINVYGVLYVATKPRWDYNITSKIS